LFDFFNDIVAISGIEPFESGYYFFFDETNNIRKFSLAPDKLPKVNTDKALLSDFILGGICFRHYPSCDDLYTKLNLPKSVPELKAKYLFTSKDFLMDIQSDRTTAFIDWLYRQDEVYLHYAVENNLYFALADIVDSLYEKQPHMMIFHAELKDALYRICKKHQDVVLDILCDYAYPNVSQDFIYDFTRELVGLIAEANVEEDFYTETLRQMLKSIRSDSEMVFIQDNVPFVLMDNYALLYINRCVTFSNSTIIFDIETEVMAYIERTKAALDIGNYSFADSKTNKYIQISDCVVGMIGKLFEFLDQLDMSEISSLLLSKRQLDNLNKIKEIIDKSDEKSKLLILNINAQSLTNERYMKLKMITEG